MDEINKIRKAFLIHGEKKNVLAKRFNRSWDTINRIVTTPLEEFENRGRRPTRKARVITPEVLLAIEAYFDEEVTKKVRKKQKYTGTRIYKDLKASGLYKGSERGLLRAVSMLREKRSQSKAKSFLPLHFPLGSSLQVDHGEADVIIGNKRFTVYLFIASVPGKSLRFCQIFPTKSSEAWGEFHERAFKFFGGVFITVVYDNDSVLVKEVLGAERRQTSFSHSLEEHYEFESHFCNVASGNEKGAVENGVGYCRRNFIPGCPTFADWDEANEYLLNCCKLDIKKGIHYKSKQPLQSIFEELKEKVRPLPPKKKWHKWLPNCRVNSCQLVTVDHHDYSVPEKYVGSSVRIGLGIFHVNIFKDDDLIAMHERKYDNSDSLVLDHYLDQLQYKSAALWDCTAVNNHKFDSQFLELWNRFSEKYPKAEANRQFVKVLLLKRRYSYEDLLQGVQRSLKCKVIDYSSVEDITRQIDADRKNLKEKEFGLMLKPTYVQSWEFDVSAYAELCGGVSL